MVSKFVHRFVLYLGALFTITAIASAALVFLAYPMQTLLSIVAMIIIWAVILFFLEWDR